MNIQRLLCFLAVLIACENRIHAETVWDSQDDSGAYRQRLSLGYRMSYNISTKFNNTGGFSRSSNPGPASGSNVNRTYDNGFNKVDISGNAGGNTWFWGYSSASQIVGDSVVMSSRSTSGNYSSEASDDPQHGVELTYTLELGGRGKWKWGLEASANYTKVNISDDRALRGDVRVISDAFALNGITPPMAPYAGTFTGPGPVIGSTPSRTTSTISGGATIAGKRELDADLCGVHLGPYFEFPLSHRTSLSFSGGLALVGISSDFRFRENVTIAGGGTITRNGSSSDDDILAGGYISGNFNFQMTERFSLFAGIQYYDLGTHEQQSNGKAAVLDLSNSIGVLLGASVSF